MNGEKMINVAILGTGGIASSHVEGFLAFPERCRIVALANRTPAKAEALKAKHNLDCRIVSDARELADSDDVDLAVVLTPPAAHAEQSVMLLRSGKHVLLEKPMAMSPDECEAILAAERESGRMVSVVAQNRFKTPAMRMKKVIDSGILGALNHIQVNSFWWRSGSYYDLYWRGRWDTEGGGCTLIHSVHHIDLMLWLVGMPYELRSIFDNLAHDNSEVEDISLTLMRFKPHLLGQLTSSIVHYGEEQSIVLQAGRAGIALPWRVMSLTARENGFPAGDDEKTIAEIQSFYDSLPELEHEGHTGQIDDVLAAIEQNRPPIVTARDGANAISLVRAVYKSALENAPVALPMAADDPYRSSGGFLSKAVKFHEKTRNIEAFRDNEIVVGSISQQKK